MNCVGNEHRSLRVDARQAIAIKSGDNLMANQTFCEEMSDALFWWRVKTRLRFRRLQAGICRRCGK